MAKPFAFRVGGMGADARIRNVDNSQSVLLADTGNTTISNASGNIIASGSQFVAAAQIVFLNGTATVAETMMTATNVASILTGAATIYHTLTASDAPNLNIASRVNIVPNAGGTEIDSIVIASPNPDGRIILLQNLGLSAAITLPSRNASGTSGGQFLTSGSGYTVAAGGGALIIFDATVTPGFWHVVGIP